MELSQFFFIIFISSIFCYREKLHIIDIDNPNFKGDANDNLIFGFNNMKHGASSPCYGLDNYYRDIFGQKWDGFCELTKKGFLQVFKLGKIFQTRFKKLLDIDHPNINKVKAYASQANKTLMSANALFYGMYINKDTPIYEQITVPVRNYKNYNGSELIPIFYYTDSSNCKGWKKIVEKNKNNKYNKINEYMDRFMKSYSNIFDLLKDDERMTNSKSLLDKINLFCSSYISNYYDERCPKIEIFKSLNYTDQQFFDLYYDCIEFNLYKDLFIEYGYEGRRVPSTILAELVNEIIFYMDSIIQNPNNITKFVSYTGHDSSMAGLQIILENAFNIPPKLINYASNQLFLLYKVGNNEQNIEKNYKVKYFYNDQLSATIEYNEFKKNLLNVIQNNNFLEYFCESFQPLDYVVLSLCSGIIILLVAIFSICFYHRNILFTKKVYMSLKEEPKEKSVDIKN